MTDGNECQKCILLMVCETMFAERVVELLNEVQVPGYTRVGGVSGVGETGRHEGTAIWPGTNTVIFSALPDEGMADLIMKKVEKVITEHYARRPGFAAFKLAGSQLG